MDVHIEHIELTAVKRILLFFGSNVTLHLLCSLVFALLKNCGFNQYMDVHLHDVLVFSNRRGCWQLLHLISETLAVLFEGCA